MAVTITEGSYKFPDDRSIHVHDFREVRDCGKLNVLFCYSLENSKRFKFPWED